MPFIAPNNAVFRQPQQQRKEESSLKRIVSIFLAVTFVCLLGAAVTAHAKGNLSYSISVAKFPNESGWHGK